MNKNNRPAFIPGLELSEGFFREAVKPILDGSYPGLQYSAALIGGGSEILGFDTEMSTDHHWGPRTMLFLLPDDFEFKKDAIRVLLSNNLPLIYKGYPTNFTAPDPDDSGVQHLRHITSGPVNHRVEIFTINGFFNEYLNIDTDKNLKSTDWLTLPQQKLRSIISGLVFHDGLGLEEFRKRFTWYPHDVWLFILASLWQRIGQEEHLMGRAEFVGDEIGSSIIGSRLVRDIMRLIFIMHKKYPPYAKWFGTAFSRLDSSKKLGPVLTKALHAKSWQEREKYLSIAYSQLAEIHNNLEITEPLPIEVGLFHGKPFKKVVDQFHSRPFKVISGEKFASAIIKKIKDPQITLILKRSPIGSIDVFSDNTDLLEETVYRSKLRLLYE